MADLFRPTDTCWRVERSTRATVIVDADDYFRAARQAMMKAKTQILLIGWDFDARIDLTPAAIRATAHRQRSAHS